MNLRLGTRGSQLALAQAAKVETELDRDGHDVERVEIASHGDRSQAIPMHRIGVAGAFTAALEQALRDGEVDLAVHSLKDLPVEPAKGLELAATLPRGRSEDALIVRPEAHAEGRAPPLEQGARVATSGPRRRSQLLAVDDSLVPVDVRGNVDTRLAKLRDGWFDALVMANVALDRADLDTDGLVVHPLDRARNPCAPGQAAIAVQARAGSPAAEAVSELDDETTRQAVEAERAVLDELGGGCGLPLGAWAHRDNAGWTLDATFAGRSWHPACEPTVRRVSLSGEDPAALAEQAAEQLAGVSPSPRRPTSLPERPAGPTVLVVASEPTARTYTARLRAAGYAAEPIPTRVFEPADPPTGDLREQLRDVDWIVATSRQAAGPLGELLGEQPPDAYVATVGPATARALHGAGVPVHLAGDDTAEEMAHEIVRLGDAGDRVLLAQGDRARPEAGAVLDQAGRSTIRWEAYRTHTVDPDLSTLDLELPADAAVVMSPDNARALDLDDPSRLAETFVAFGPTTADALRTYGIDPIVPEAPRPDALLEVLP